jgi:FkbM family methyltransferase
LPAPKKVIKSKLITDIFQRYLTNKDIRIFKKSLIYYCLFRVIRNFLAQNIILNIYNFKVYGSIDKNKTSYFLLKKCEFGDYHELNIIKKISNKNKVLFLDCGCNYGFYSLYVASLSKKNTIISVEASKKTLDEFNKNLNLNNFSNIKFYNNAISDSDEKIITFNESEKDWESSITHENYNSYASSVISTIKIDTLVQDYDFKKYKIIIKVDIEGNEMGGIQGSLRLIEKSSPLIIIEFSKYIFNKQDNIEYLKNFLIRYDYSIYDTNNKKRGLNNILIKLDNLEKKQKTIGNFYLIKNSSKILKGFLS